MKISHESPLSLLEKSREYNDYDYALVHLFEENKEYYQFFKDSVDNNRHVLLDNSIFELGTAFDSDRYAHWINELRPTEYILPDYLFSATETIKNADGWVKKYNDLPGKKIGVIQGIDYKSFVKCYNHLNNELNLEKIAIPFNSPYFQEICPHANKWMGNIIGRVHLLTKMLEDGIINLDKPHHLLGCSLPMEFLYYRGFEWIETMDTSNPIVHGLLGIRYEQCGLFDKAEIKLVDLLDAVPNDKQLDDIMYNIGEFRKMVPVWNK